MKMAPCRFIIDRHIGGILRPHLQGRRNIVSDENCQNVADRLTAVGKAFSALFTLGMEATLSIETSVHNKNRTAPCPRKRHSPTT
jgi:hypothetical protein